MRVFVASKDSECIVSTTLTDISYYVGSSASSLRVLFSNRNSDSITVKGWNVYRRDLQRISGRGRNVIA